jgi:hypothetical protein
VSDKKLLQSTEPLPEYPCFDQAPAHLKTKNQLAEQGHSPGGPMRAYVVWKGGRRSAALDDVNEAVPKRAASDAQRAVLAQVRETADGSRRTCLGCERVLSLFRWGLATANTTRRGLSHWSHLPFFLR